MARPTLHSPDVILDAARSVLLRAGLAGATIQAISAESGAPVGSLYNRFQTRGAILTRLWLRAAKRSQAATLHAANDPDPRRAALALIDALLEFTRDEPEDARLLAWFRLEELLAGELPDELALELTTLNEPVEKTLRQLSRRLFGDAREENVRRVMLAVLSLPLAAVEPYLRAGRPVPSSVARSVARAAQAILEADEQHD